VVADAVCHRYRARRRRLARLYQASKPTVTARESQTAAEFEDCDCEEEIVGFDDECSYDE
jgi:hypothetical protein